MPPFRFLLCFLLVACVSMGCSRVPRYRTLPPSVRTISVPMFVNRTAEPQIEEDATRFTQEEFLADGRLDLVRQGEADAIVRVTLRDFIDRGATFDADDFPSSREFTIIADVEIVRNVPEQPLIGGRRTVSATTFFNNETRSADFVPEPRGMDQALRTLAQRIVWEVLTGAYETEATDPG